MHALIPSTQNICTYHRTIEESPESEWTSHHNDEKESPSTKPLSILSLEVKHSVHKLWVGSLLDLQGPWDLAEVDAAEEEVDLPMNAEVGLLLSNGLAQIMNSMHMQYAIA